jgi:hypothetical protein
MSAEQDRNDQRTLAYIGRWPGSKRSDPGVVRASVTRLISAGLIYQPSTNGKLFLTPPAKPCSAGGTFPPSPSPQLGLRSKEP